MLLPPLIIGSGSAVRGALHIAQEGRVVLADASAAPDMRAIGVYLVVECVINCDICACNPINHVHLRLEVWTMTAVALAHVEDEEVSVYHLVLDERDAFRSSNRNGCIHTHQQCLNEILARTQLEQRLTETDYHFFGVSIGTLIAYSSAGIHALAPLKDNGPQAVLKELGVEANEHCVNIGAGIDQLPLGMDQVLGLVKVVIGDGPAW